MGLLKTLRTGGGLGAGPFVPGACFLREKGQCWGPEPLPQFPTCAMSSRLLSCQRKARGPPQLGSPPGAGAASPPTAAQCSQHPTSQYRPRGLVGTLPAPIRVLQHSGPQPGPPAGTGHGFGHAPAPQEKPDWLEQSVAVGRAGDNRPAPGTGNGGRRDSGCPSQGSPGLGARRASQPPPPTCIPAHPGDRAPARVRGHATAPSQAAPLGWGQWRGGHDGRPRCPAQRGIVRPAVGCPPGSGFLAQGGRRPS